MLKSSFERFTCTGSLLYCFYNKGFCVTTYKSVSFGRDRKSSAQIGITRLSSAPLPLRAFTPLFAIYVNVYGSVLFYVLALMGIKRLEVGCCCSYLSLKNIAFYDIVTYYLIFKYYFWLSSKLMNKRIILEEKHGKYIK